MPKDNNNSGADPDRAKSSEDGNSTKNLHQSHPTSEIITITRNYTASKYIKPNCDSDICPCHEQERSLNQSLRNLPSSSSECDTDCVAEEFTEQILLWTSSAYECAPSLRSSCKMITVSNFVYIFGGFNPNISKNAFHDAYRFDTLTKRWKKLQVENLPSSLISYAVCLESGEDDHKSGYLFGGSYDSEGSKMSNELFKFVIDSKGEISFKKLAVDGKKPSQRYGCSMILTQEGNLYLVGGVDDRNYLGDIWILDTKSKNLRWKQIEQTQRINGRYTHEAVLVYDKILLLGGGNGNWSASLEKIDSFDITTNKFVQIQTLKDDIHGYPHARQFHSAVTYNNDIYIMGGWAKKKASTSFDKDDAVLFNDIWKLAPIYSNGNGNYCSKESKISFKWNRISNNLKIPVFMHTSAITQEGYVYTFGGCLDAKTMYPSNKLQRFWVEPLNYIRNLNPMPFLCKKGRMKEEAFPVLSHWLEKESPWHTQYASFQYSSPITSMSSRVITNSLCLIPQKNESNNSTLPNKQHIPDKTAEEELCRVIINFEQNVKPQRIELHQKSETTFDTTMRVSSKENLQLMNKNLINQDQEEISDAEEQEDMDYDESQFQEEDSEPEEEVQVPQRARIRIGARMTINLPSSVGPRSKTLRSKCSRERKMYKDVPTNTNI